MDRVVPLEDINSNTISQQAPFKWIRGAEVGTDPEPRCRVFIGMNMTTGELIAAKQIQLSIDPPEEQQARKLLRKAELEIDILKRLEHPNIIRFIGYEQSQQNMSMFLEYVAGGSVAHLLRNNKKIGEDLVGHFSKNILSGLEYLHNEGIMHRNLRCDNVLLDHEGTCKIAGFGSAKKTNNIYQNDPTNCAQGSVFWSAPEVVESHGNGYSGKIDIWGLGCCILEMFSGQRPWIKEDENGAAQKLRNLEYPDLSGNWIEVITPQVLSLMLDCFTMYVTRSLKSRSLRQFANKSKAIQQNVQLQALSCIIRSSRLAQIQIYCLQGFRRSSM
jgi:mitogen-activated protein kinase kinase kinase